MCGEHKQEDGGVSGGIKHKEVQGGGRSSLQGGGRSSLQAGGRSSLQERGQPRGVETRYLREAEAQLAKERPEKGGGALRTSAAVPAGAAATGKCSCVVHCWGRKGKRTRGVGTWDLEAKARAVYTVGVTNPSFSLLCREGITLMGLTFADALVVLGGAPS